jgi:hypothetical protein
LLRTNKKSRSCDRLFCCTPVLLSGASGGSSGVSRSSSGVSRSGSVSGGSAFGGSSGSVGGRSSGLRSGRFGSRRFGRSSSFFFLAASGHGNGQQGGQQNGVFHLSSLKQNVVDIPKSVRDF